MSLALFLLMTTVCVMTGGCATIENYPKTMVEVEVQLKDLLNDYTTLKGKYNEALIEYSKTELNTKRTGVEEEKSRKRVRAELKRLRNEIIEVCLLDIDLNFLNWERCLLKQGAIKDVSFSATAIALDLATAVAPAVGTARILGAVKGGIDSTRLSVNKDLFFQKTIDTLLITMKGNRAKKLSEIKDDMKKGIDTYPLREAERDLLQYYEAGTIPGALSGILLDAGEKKQEAAKPKKPGRTFQATVRGLDKGVAEKLEAACNDRGADAKTDKENGTYAVSVEFRQEDLDKKVVIGGLTDDEAGKLVEALNKTKGFHDAAKEGKDCVTVLFGEGVPPKMDKSVTMKAASKTQANKLWKAFRAVGVLLVNTERKDDTWTVKATIRKEDLPKKVPVSAIDGPEADGLKKAFEDAGATADIKQGSTAWTVTGEFK